MSYDIIEAVDWRGNAVDCQVCSHRDLKERGTCRPGHACVNDRYARRIDRFFNWNPALADSYVKHDHFEVRAIAAKHATVFLLPPLLDDPDEAVRWNAARRLPKRLITKLRHDPHREVRIRVVTLLEDGELIAMMDDPDYYVRLVICRRIDCNLLLRMVHDDETEVRRVVAARLPQQWLTRMVDDCEAVVRLEVARRLAPDVLHLMKNDSDWRVRYEVASRMDVAEIVGLSGDEDSLVREVVQARLADQSVRVTDISR
ncbi:MAG: 4Fe4S-binding leucine-rich repeat protein [Methylovirgula sp.]